MVKLLSQLIGAKVLLYQERAIVGQVARVLIDSDDGSFVGLAVNPVHQSGLAYIPVNEIKGYGQGFLMVEDLNSLSEAEDVVKIKKVLEAEPTIIGAKVQTESGQRVGRVEDATVDVKFSILKKLYVNPPFPLGTLGTQRIIDQKQIITIEKKLIVVQDGTIPQNEALVAPGEAPVLE